MGLRFRSFISVRNRQLTGNEPERPWVQLATDWRIWLCIFQYIWLIFKETSPNFKLPVRLRTAFTTQHAEAELGSGGFTGGLDSQWDTLGLILELGCTVETASCSVVSTPHPASPTRCGAEEAFATTRLP